MEGVLAIAEEVQEALAAGRGVVALETSVVAQGLPWPRNVEAARRCELAIRRSGSVPATVAILGGRVVVGASDEQLMRLAEPGRQPAKAGARDLAPLLLARRDAGMTVSATCAVAARAGIRLFATGGIGGVHRAAPGEGSAERDVSADLGELAHRAVCVVSAGPKAILDLAATAEALETLGVPVVGWRTSEMPAFWSERSGVALEHRVEDAPGAATLLTLRWRELGQEGGLLLCVPPLRTLSREVIEAAIEAAIREARARRLGGKALTPFLLAAVDRATGGSALDANLDLLEENARVAGAVAAALAEAR
jgi:pseudouridine-5'-phosphate glycosidase